MKYKYHVTIEFREYDKNVLKRSISENEYNLEFDGFLEMKRYVTDRVYSCFETRSIEPSVSPHFSGKINEGLYTFNLMAVVGETMYECQAYITNELYVPRS